MKVYSIGRELLRFADEYIKCTEYLCFGYVSHKRLRLKIMAFNKMFSVSHWSCNDSLAALVAVQKGKYFQIILITES